jgi:hypothetical protein
MVYTYDSPAKYVLYPGTVHIDKAHLDAYMLPHRIACL